MNKRVFVSFGLLALVLAVVIPFWAFSRDGSEPSTSDTEAVAEDLFATNCGTCHTLDAAGADGVVGPNLDQLLGTAPGQDSRVLSAIDGGIDGRMPAGILQGQNAELVAEYVASVAGQ